MKDQPEGMMVVVHTMGFAREVGNRVVMDEGGLWKKVPSEMFANRKHPRRAFLSRILGFKKPSTGHGISGQLFLGSNGQTQETTSTKPQRPCATERIRERRDSGPTESPKKPPTCPRRGRW